MTIKKKLTLLLSLLFIFTFSNIISIYILESKNDDATASIQYSNQILQITEHVMQHLLVAETSQRGYLLTKDRYYLSDFYTAVRQTKDHLEDLNIMIKVDLRVNQKRIFDRINKVTMAKIDELNHTLKMGESDLDKAITIVRSDSGKDYMRSVVHYISALNDSEQARLRKLHEKHQKINYYINMMTVAELLIMIFFVITTYIVMKKNLFQPLRQLVDVTKKMEAGERQHISDFLPKDEIGYLMSSFYDMSEVIIDRHEDLKESAYTDELTKVNNRLGLYKDIETSIASTEVDNASLVLCFVDLDEFKQMNDRLGHDCGDEMLKTVAKRLKNELRSADAIYRYGGDEFIILMKGIISATIAHQMVDRLMEVMSEPFVYGGENLRIKFSLGYAISPEQATDPEILIKYADIAMYRSKREGKQKAKFFNASMLNTDL